MKQLKDLIRITKLNDKVTLKWKTPNRQNVSLKSELEGSQAKATQLENQRNILSNNLIDASKDKALLKEQVEKASKDLEALKKKLSDYMAKKADLTQKLKMPTYELSTAKAYLECMNTGSKKLDDILCTQKLPFDKCGLGFTDSTSGHFKKFR